MSRQNFSNREPFGQTALDDKTDFERPKLYGVRIHNDDYTPMDFVVLLLIKVFRKTQGDATEIMMDIHQKGERVVGIYSYDVAVTKRTQAQVMADQSGHPLKITMDEVME